MRRLVTLLLILAFLASCSGPFGEPADDLGDDLPSPVPTAPGGPAAETGSVKISFAVWESERSIYEPLAQKFSADHPNITVVFVPLEDLMNVSSSGGPDSQLNMVRRIVSGADVASSMFVPAEAYGSKLLLNLAPLMDADANFKRDDFYPGVLEQFTMKGGTWVLPRYTYVQLLSYNKDLFAAANVPAPKPGWSWNDLLATAEQLVAQGGGGSERYGFFDMSGGLLPLLAIMQAQGINLLNTPTKDMQLERPEIIAGIERIQALRKSHALYMPDGQKGRNIGPEGDYQQLIRDGRIGIWMSDMVQTFSETDGSPKSTEFSFPVGKVPMPVADIPFFSTSNDGYVISGGTAHPNEAWLWIEFLSRQPFEPGGPGRRMFDMPGRIPVRQSMAEATGFWKDIDEESALAYKWAIEHYFVPVLQTPDYTAIGALSQAVSQVLNEDKDPRKALAEVQKQFQEQVVQVQLTPSPTPDLSAVLVATPEAQSAPEGATQITFGAPYGSSEMRAIVRAFQKQHPDIFVQLKSTQTMTMPPDLTSLAQSNDCFSWWGAPQSDTEFKALLDLQPLFDSDTGIALNDYPSMVLAAYRHGGGLFGLPYVFNIRSLSYNRTAFDAAGIAVPTYHWTPSDFLAAAQALTKGDGEQKQYGFVSLGNNQQDMVFFINQFGGQLTTGSGKDLRPNFNDPTVVAAIQWYIDLAKVHKVMPPIHFPYRRDDQGSNDKSFELLQSGRAGMWFSDGYGKLNAMFGPGSSTPSKFEVEIAPLPIGAKGLSKSDFYVRGFHISAHTQQAQACWEFLKFLSSDLTDLQGSIPARMSIAQSDAFTKQSPEIAEIVKIYAEALKQESRQSGGSDLSPLAESYWLFKAISETIENDADLAKGLDEAQKTTTAFLECVAADEKPATCATKVDPTYQGFITEDQGEGGGGIPVPRG